MHVLGASGWKASTACIAQESEDDPNHDLEDYDQLFDGHAEQEGEVGDEPSTLHEQLEEAVADEQQDLGMDEMNVDAMIDAAFSDHLRPMPTLLDLEMDEAPEKSSEVEAVAVPLASPPVDIVQVQALQVVAVPSVASPPVDIVQDQALQAVAVPVPAVDIVQEQALQAVAVPVASPPVETVQVQALHAVAVPVASPPVERAPAPMTEVAAVAEPAHAPKPEIVDLDNLPTPAPKPKRNDFNQTAVPENTRIKLLREVLEKLRNLICTNAHRCMRVSVCVCSCTCLISFISYWHAWGPHTLRSTQKQRKAQRSEDAKRKNGCLTMEVLKRSYSTACTYNHQQCALSACVNPLYSSFPCSRYLHGQCGYAGL